jgi:hypothetical protein
VIEEIGTAPGVRHMSSTKENTMAKLKLNIEDVDIESFETIEVEESRGTVQGNLLRTVDDGTCRGQTGLCTGCTPINCY